MDNDEMTTGHGVRGTHKCLIDELFCELHTCTCIPKHDPIHFKLI